jgi:AcrR family transcriptional regulator
MATDSATVPAVDRRQRRRQETITEVLDIAVDIMATEGVAGLSLGEVARRMGIRPPSLYVYFPSKHALYDAVFARGAAEVLAHMRVALSGIGTSDGSLEEMLLATAHAFVGWSVQHPAYTQLLFWRPVPGFAPSAEAYAPAVELVHLSNERFTMLRQRGLIRADADLDEVQRDWTVLNSGVISQQLSNAPDQPFDEGVFTSRLPALVAMFARHYGAPPTSATGRDGNDRQRTTRKR